MLSLGAGLSLVWLIGSGLSAAQAPAEAAATDRPADPAIVTGASFPGLAGAPLNQLFVYAYRSGAWAPIPFQIDEVNLSGTLVVSDDGLLDANDQLLFMPADAGEYVTASVWLTDPLSRIFPRYAITVTDPLSAANQAWAYLYRSTTLTRSNISYVNWNSATQTATGISYTVDFNPAQWVGLADLSVNGSVDVLDRQKVRTEILGGLFKINEEGLTAFGPPTLTLPAVGPIRAATGSGNLQAAFYGSRMDINLAFDLSGLGPVLPDFIRTSFDWNNPITTGLTTYYDSNTPLGVTIDGVTDTISTTPRIDWFQVNGGGAGPGGIVMAIPVASGGTLANYYKDNGAVDAADTGDKRSYSDAGLRINAPGSFITFTLLTYILPPGASSNVGAAYFARANAPLTAASEQQVFAAAASIYLPVIMR